MTNFDYKLRTENTASQRAGGRYNPATVILWSFNRKKYRAVIAAGNSDEVKAFRSGDEIIVVSRNCGMGYCGAEAFPIKSELPAVKQEAEDFEDVNPKRSTIVARSDVFLQNAVEELGHDKWEDWTLRHLGKVLSEWLY